MKYLTLLLIATAVAVPGHTTQASTDHTTDFEAVQQIQAIIDQLNALIIIKGSDSATSITTDVSISSGSVAGASTTVLSDTLLIQSDSQTVFTTNVDLTSAEAHKICEDHAYAFDNYFKNVTCEHLGEIIYDYTFIPG